MKARTLLTLIVFLLSADTFANSPPDPVSVETVPPTSSRSLRVPLKINREVLTQILDLDADAPFQLEIWKRDQAKSRVLVESVDVDSNSPSFSITPLSDHSTIHEYFFEIDIVTKDKRERVQYLEVSLLNDGGTLSLLSREEVIDLHRNVGSGSVSVSGRNLEADDIPGVSRLAPGESFPPVRCAKGQYCEGVVQ